MKTLCLTLGLLLLTFCLQFSTAPGNCCFKFSTMRIPLNRITDITKTHRSCLKKGFIVTTKLKRQICFRLSSDWVLKVYNKVYTNEGST
uniref:C-C motif chemokine 18-like n=1 Tax=Kryptolebias marmoratus TaxID=37003 RepID=A0A3Q3AXU4_KRYMA